MHYGGNGTDGIEIHDILRENEVDRGFSFDGKRTGPYSGGYFRSEERNSPHNACANLSWMLDNAWPSDENGAPYEPRLPLLRFSETPTQGIQTALEIEIHFEGVAKKEPNYLACYTYNAENREYERWYCGYKQIDGSTGKRITAANVIVQYCELSFNDGLASNAVIGLTGEGRMDAYIDGFLIQGYWRRDSVPDQTQYLDSNGEPLVLLPGKTFIQIIPTSYGFAFDTESGMGQYAPDL